MVWFILCEIHLQRESVIMNLKQTIKNCSAFQTAVVFFTIHLINMYSSFQNNVHTTKQMQYTLERILSDFLSDGFLIFFKNIEMSMELYNEEKSVAQPSVVMT